MMKILLCTIFFFSLLSSGRASLAEQFVEIHHRASIDFNLGLTNGVLERINLQFRKCSSFPYYGESEDGLKIIHRAFLSAINKVHTYLGERGDSLSPYVTQKLEHLSYLLIDAKIQKTFDCRFGETSSFIALASDSPSDDSIEKYSMAPFPSIIFDINRMAGNFPMDANPERFRAFYGNRLDGVEVIGGRRNPLAARTVNPESLIFHEMMHWTGSKHFDKAYVDVVYLTQFCFFSYPNISKKLKQESCLYLEDDLLWQGNDIERLQYISDKSVRIFVKNLKKLYHSHY